MDRNHQNMISLLLKHKAAVNAKVCMCVCIRVCLCVCVCVCVCMCILYMYVISSSWGCCLLIIFNPSLCHTMNCMALGYYCIPHMRMHVHTRTHVYINVCMYAQDADGQIPLHYACNCEHNDIIMLLLKHGADPHVRDSDGVSSVDIVQGSPSKYAKEVLLKLKKKK